MALKDVTVNVDGEAYDLGAAVSNLGAAVKTAAADGLDLNDALSVFPHVMPIIAAFNAMRANPQADKGKMIEGLMVGLADLPDSILD